MGIIRVHDTLSLKLLSVAANEMQFGPGASWCPLKSEEPGIEREAWFGVVVAVFFLATDAHQRGYGYFPSDHHTKLYPFISNELSSSCEIFLIQELKS